MPAASSPWRRRLRSSKSAEAMRRERSRKGVLSVRQIWWSTPLAKPTSHSSVENTLQCCVSLCCSLSFHSLLIEPSPKWKEEGSMGGTVLTFVPGASITMSAAYKWAIMVPTRIAVWFNDSFWSSTRKLFLSSILENSTVSWTNTLGGRAGEATRSVISNAVSYLSILFDFTNGNVLCASRNG